jgi:hypothetical protein
MRLDLRQNGHLRLKLVVHHDRFTQTSDIEWQAILGKRKMQNL